MANSGIEINEVIPVMAGSNCKSIPAVSLLKCSAHWQGTEKQKQRSFNICTYAELLIWNFCHVHRLPKFPYFYTKFTLTEEIHNNPRFFFIIVARLPCIPHTLTSSVPFLTNNYSGKNILLQRLEYATRIKGDISI